MAAAGAWRALGQELTQLVKETALTWCSLAEEEHSAREQAFVAVLSLAQALSVVGSNNADATAGVPEGRVALSHDPTLRSTLSKLVGSGGDDGYLAVAQLAFGLLQAEDAAEDAAATSQVDARHPFGEKPQWKPTVTPFRCLIFQWPATT